MNDSCSDTELGMGGGGRDSFHQREVEGDHLMSIKREMEQEEVTFYKSILSGQREFLTAGRSNWSGRWRDGQLLPELYGKRPPQVNL